MCTHEEIGAILDCCVETLDSACKSAHGVSFSDYYEQKSSNGKASLRRKQWEMALKGDRVMLIWLGKQHLGQADKLEDKHTTARIVEPVYPSMTKEQAIELLNKEQKTDV